MDNTSVAPRRMSLHFLEEITNNFSNDRIIGVGSYGSVYKGEEKNGETFAVKLLHYIPGLDDLEFKKEYLNLASLQHKNVVRLIGYCHETRREFLPFNGKIELVEVTKRALSFEYLPNGSLDKFLSDELNGHDWHTCYKIIKGICQGLKYLHEDLESPMYHLDLKPANVLLDENMVAKLADFGLSRLFGGETTQMTKSPTGTLGYVPPEFIDATVISNKFDIFSLGVVMIKILTGPTGYFRSEEMSPQEFIELIHAKWRSRLHAASVNMLDSCSEQVKRCIEIALSCLQGDRYKRPSIGLIVNKLNETETLIQSPDKDIGSSIYKVIYMTTATLRSWSRLQRVGHRDLFMEVCTRLEDTICHCISSQTKLMDNPLNKLFSYTIDVTDNRGQLHKPKIYTVCRRKDDASTFEEPIRPKIEIIDYKEGLGSATRIDIHPTEPWVLVGHSDGYVSVWNHQTKARLMAFNEQKVLRVYAVRFIARKEWIIAGDNKGQIHVYTYTTTKSKLKEFRAHVGQVRSLEVHPTDPLVLSSSYDKLIKLWNWENGWECIRTFQSHSSWVSSVKFSPQTASNNTFASASWDGTVKIWSMLSDTPLTTLECGRDHLLSVDYFVVHGNHEYIVTGSSDGTAHIWNLETETCIQHIEALQKYGGAVTVLDCLPGHPILVTVSDDRIVSFCNSTTHRYQNMVDFKMGYIVNSAYIKDTRSLVVASQEGIAIMEIS